MANKKSQFNYRQAYRDRQRLLKIKVFIDFINKILCQIGKEDKLKNRK